MPIRATSIALGGMTHCGISCFFCNVTALGLHLRELLGNYNLKSGMLLYLFPFVMNEVKYGGLSFILILTYQAVISSIFTIFYSVAKLPCTL